MIISKPVDTPTVCMHQVWNATHPTTCDDFGGELGICDTDGFCYLPQGNITHQSMVANNQPDNNTDIFAVTKSYQSWLSAFVSSPDIQYFEALNTCDFYALHCIHDNIYIHAARGGPTQ